MATFTGTNGADLANANTGSITGFTGGSLALLQDALGDTFEGAQGADTVVAGAGDDLIRGQTGADSLDGEAGNDTLEGGDGIDTVRGGTGNDIIRIGAGDLSLGDSMNGGADTDTLEITAAGIFDFRTNATILNIEALRFAQSSGTVTADFSATQIGFSAITQVEGSAGTDLITVFGPVVDLSALTFANWTDGTDIITIIMNENDTVVGSSRNDIFDMTEAAFARGFGGAGDDLFLIGDKIVVSCNGQTGIDTFDISAYGGLYDLNMVTGETTYAESMLNFEHVIMTSSANVVTGTSSANHITLGAGDDFAEGGGGADTLFGDAGNDRFRYSAAADIVAGESINGGADTDEIEIIAAGAYNFKPVTVALVEMLDFAQVSGTATASFVNVQIGAGGIASIDGSAGTDALVVDGSTVDLSSLIFTSWTDGTDTIAISGTSIGGGALTGSSRNDVITAFNIGASTLNGGAGADTLNGGADSDTADYSASAVAMTLDLAAGIFSGGDAAGDVLTSIENLRGGSNNDVINGLNDANVLTGNGGIDYIEGYAGTDQLQGDAGDDLLSGGADADTLLGGAENDQLHGGAGGDSLDGGTGIDILNGNADIDTLNGGDGDDYLYGGSENDTLSGGNNNDNLYGEDGADTLDGGVGINILNGNAGNDSLTLGAGTGYAYGGADNDTLTGGLLNDVLSGEDGNDSIIGSDDIDALHGGAGSDSLNGGAGGDYLYGGTGPDNLIGGFGNDVIYAGNDFGPFTDGIVDAIVFNSGDGIDALYGFEAGLTGQDVMRLLGTGYADFSAVMANTYDFAGYSVIVTSVTSQIYVYGVQKAQYDAGDFQFV